MRFLSLKRFASIGATTTPLMKSQQTYTLAVGFSDG